MKRVVYVNFLVLVSLILILDVLGFIFLPTDATEIFSAYRSTSSPEVGGRERYPVGYFVQHPRSGFDIGKNKTGDHWVAGRTHPVWSNTLGCFDRNYSHYDDYVYFAGDSFTWGYTPFAESFGSVAEQLTGTQILKCGVTHTGQLHQLEKLSEIVSEIGKPPKAVFIFYYANDIANDFAYPHTTVIHGWQVDNVALDSNNELVMLPRDELTARVEEKLSRVEEIRKVRSGWKEKIKEKLKYYSISVNIIIHLKYRFDEMMRTQTLPSATKLSTKQANPLKKIYHLPQQNNGVFWYLENPKAQKNKAALVDFAKFTRDRNAELVVVIIPPRHKATNKQWYQELRQFLTDKNIKYLDLTMNFSSRKVVSNGIYLKDGHLNAAGNRLVAEILTEEFSDIFHQDIKSQRNAEVEF